MKTVEPLLALLPPPEAKHALIVEPVAPILALREGLVCIWITKTVGSEVVRWKLPIQWTPREAGELMQLIRGVSWQLAEDEFQPIDLIAIREIMQTYIGGFNATNER